MQEDLESDEYHPKKALSLADSESPVILPDKYTHTQFLRTNPQKKIEKRKKIDWLRRHTLNSM